MDKQMEKALNDQINAEMASAYLYLGMSSYFTDRNLKGFAQWMRVQAKEEMGHAMKIFDFVQERLGSVSLGAIAAPKGKWTSPAEVMKATLAHEKKVTGLIHGLVAMAKAKKDYATEVFLQWFVKEQVEEEANADEIVQQLKMIGDQPGPLFMLDSVLGKRE
jgi:ferritin